MENKYKQLSDIEHDEMFSNFMVDSWSFSKIATFARNEKEFEKSYIYRVTSRRSASSVAGNAYHEALKHYFINKKTGVDVDIAELEQIAFNYIEKIPANKWKLQKTNPTVEDCKITSLKVSSLLINNFIANISKYELNDYDIVDAELYLDEWLVINGVDIPMPCYAQIDLILKHKKNNSIVIVDHKSKKTFTDEQVLKFTGGKQAITYAKCYESYAGVKVSEVWYIENKYSKNKNGKDQLQCLKIPLTEDTTRLYEAMIYEPLRRMVEAISDPDYVYLLNDNDNFIDQAELNEFWAHTMIAEVEDFEIPDSKKELVKRRLKKVRDSSLSTINPVIIKNYKQNAATFIKYDLNKTDMTNPEKIEHILRTFGIVTNVAHTFNGYSSDTFLVEVSAGVKMTAIHQRRLDIANALDVANIRMQKDLYVHDGRSYLAIEVSKKRDKDLLFNKKYLNGLKIPLGIDNFDKTIYWDIENPSTPHMLICGATGSGKSVSIASTIEYARLAGINDVYIFDPKYEFLNYKNIKGIKVFSDIEDIEDAMHNLVKEMNNRVIKGISSKTLIVFDEFADAVANSKKGNELKVYENQVVGMNKNLTPKTKRVHIKTLNTLEQNLKILLQKGRSTGFRIIAATQRASVKVITGDAKVNFPVQICFRVPKEIDSKVVIDESGGEALAGKGDGLLKSPEYLNVIRFQSFYKK